MGSLYTVVLAGIYSARLAIESSQQRVQNGLSDLGKSPVGDAVFKIEPDATRIPFMEDSVLDTLKQIIATLVFWLYSGLMLKLASTLNGTAYL